MQKIAISILIISALCSQGLALMCYNCDAADVDTSPCGDNFNGTSISTSTCTGTKPSCYKVKVYAGGQAAIRRGCTPLNINCDIFEATAKQTGADDVECGICTTDLCNSSPAVMAGLATVLFASLLALCR